MSSRHQKLDSSVIEVQMEVMARPDVVYSADRDDCGRSCKTTRVPIQKRLLAQVVQDFNLQHLEEGYQAKFTGQSFPFVNPEYAYFFPQLVENYWMKRFDGNMPIRPDNYRWRDFNLIWMNYEDEDCGCMKQQDEERFAENVVYSWFNYGRGVRVIASKFHIVQQTGHIVFQREKPILLVLHDFYYHPLCLFRVFNELNKSHNLVIPYVHDIAGLAAKYRNGDGLQLMADKIQDVLNLVVDNYVVDFSREFGILAHGTSCQLAVSISNQFKCSKLTLLNPIGVILPKPERNRVQGSSAQEPSRRTQAKNDEYSYSAESNAGVIIGVLPQSSNKHDEISFEGSGSRITLNIVRRPSFSSVSARQSAHQYSAGRHDPEKKKESRDNNQSDRRKSFSMMHHRFSSASAIVTSPEPYGCKLSASGSAGCETLEGVFLVVNKCMLDIYSRPDICKTLLGLAGAKSASDLQVCTKVAQMAVRGLSRARRKFFRLLPSLCVLTNLKVLFEYRENMQVFEQQFFSAIDFIANTVTIPVMLQRDRTTILIGSHGSLLTNAMIKQLIDIDEQNFYVQCRTVLGAGHDLFDTAIEIIRGVI